MRDTEWGLDDEGRERLSASTEKLIADMLRKYGKYARGRSAPHFLAELAAVNNKDPSLLEAFENEEREYDTNNALKIGPNEFKHVYDKVFDNISHPHNFWVSRLAPFYGDLLHTLNVKKFNKTGKKTYGPSDNVLQLLKTVDSKGNEVWNHPLLRSITLRAMLDIMREHPDEDLRKFGRHLFDTKGLTKELYDSGDPHAVAAIDAQNDIEGRVYSYLVDRNNPNIKWMQNVGYVFQLPKRIEDMTKEEYDHARNVALGKE